MPEYKVGEMFTVLNDASLFCVTTNSVIMTGRQDRLVMGKGSAGDAKLIDADLPTLFAQAILRIPDLLPMSVSKTETIMQQYGLVTVASKGRLWGALQTKYDWRKKSNLPLVEYSVGRLAAWASDNSDKAIHTAFPGIGKGQLEIADVKRMLDRLLPDNVTVWQKGTQ